MDEEHEEEIYEEGARQEAEEDDEIDELEEGFMQGYENENMANCGNCKKVLEKEVIEEEFDGEIHRFCSEKCAEEFETKRTET